MPLDSNQKNSIAKAVAEFVASDSGKKLVAANPPLAKDAAHQEFQQWLTAQKDKPSEAVKGMASALADAAKNSNMADLVAESNRLIDENIAASLAAAKGPQQDDPKPDAPKKDKGTLGEISDALSNNKNGLIGGLITAVIGAMFGGGFGAIIGLLIGGFIGGQKDQNGIVPHLGGAKRNPDVAVPMSKKGQEKSPERIIAITKDGKSANSVGSTDMVIHGHYEGEGKDRVFKTDKVSFADQNGKFEHKDNEFVFQKNFEATIPVKPDGSIDLTSKEAKDVIADARKGFEDRTKIIVQPQQQSRGIKNEPKIKFDPDNKRDVEALQNKINAFNSLGRKAYKPLEITGKMDADTKKVWLEFKKETFADGSLSIGYLKDDKGLGFSDKKLQELGVNPDALGSPPKDPKAYDRNNPPKELLEAVKSKLHVTSDKSGSLAAAIKADKVKPGGWIDDRTNPGALEQLDREISSRSAAKGVPVPDMGRTAGTNQPGRPPLAQDNARPSQSR